MPLPLADPDRSKAQVPSLAGVFKQASAGRRADIELWHFPDGQATLAAWYESDSLTIGCLGDIQNFAELSQELGLPTSQTGLGVLAEGWRRWSLDLLPKLDGVFVLIIRTGDDLILYRDPSGLRNLYYGAGANGRLFMASHLAALPCLAGSHRPLDARSVQEYLRLLEVAAPNTLLAGVMAVEAGQWVRWTSTSAVPQLGTMASKAVPLVGRFSTAVDELDRLLRASISARLAGASRPGAFLSGGIDSALLCALARRERPDLTTVTVGFDDDACDEAPVARRIAAHLGATHEVWRFTRDQYLDAFDRLSRQAEQPMADPAAMATLLAFEQCRQRFDVVLDGTGADEAVGLMPPRHVRIAVSYASRIPASVRSALARLLKATPGLTGYAPVLDFEHPADTMSRWHGFQRKEIAQLTGQTASLDHTHFVRTFHRFPSHAHFERYSALLNAMTCDRLNQAMVISGAPIRFPFWDRDTDRFIRQLRTEFRYLPGEPKRILRALLARYVPSDIWNLPKHGFNFPLRAFLTDDSHALVRQYLDAARWRAYGLLRPEAVERYGQRFMAGEGAVTFRVWALVVLGAWLEHHREVLSTRA